MIVETILCACGCGSEMPSKDSRGRPRMYLNRSHNMRSAAHRAANAERLRGHVVSAETREKIAVTKRRERNASWKGDDAKYAAIHTWLFRNCTKTGACLDCGAIGRTEWANISGEYRRGVDDYRELCTKCHRRFDRDKLGATNG